MTDWSAPWCDASVAKAQREMVDKQLAEPTLPVHFQAFADAVRETECPGLVWEVGCASGYGKEILDKTGVPYRLFGGMDASPDAIHIAAERHPECAWALGGWPEKRDVTIDGSALLHVQDWKEHIADLCSSSSRWVILHRIPASPDRTETYQATTTGYNREFPAWFFARQDVVEEMARHGFEFVTERPADGHSCTMTFAKPRIFCSYADGAYLTRLKALYRSMVKYCGPFRLHVLAWDESVWRWWDGLSDGSVSVTMADDFLGEHVGFELEALPGPRRTKAEHYWTCGPRWVADVMETTGHPVTYVDSDVLMWSSPEPVFAEIGSAPAAVFPHNFASKDDGLPGPTVESHERFGRYNVGLVHVANQRIAEDWAEKCRAWCYDKLWAESLPIQTHKLRYADQAYLNEWPEKYGAHAVEHPGACLGPWSVHRLPLETREGKVYYGGRPLVSYHYSQFKRLEDGYVASRPEYHISDEQRRILYDPYFQALKEWE